MMSKKEKEVLNTYGSLTCVFFILLLISLFVGSEQKASANHDIINCYQNSIYMEELANNNTLYWENKSIILTHELNSTNISLLQCQANLSIMNDSAHLWYNQMTGCANFVHEVGKENSSPTNEKQHSNGRVSKDG